MENKHVLFSVDKVELLNYSNDTQLAKIRMWIVREGDNAHHLPISWESISKARDTLTGKPVLCKYNKYTGNFEGHEKDEIPVGAFLNKDEIYEETIEDQKWLVADAYLWRMYFPEIIKTFQRKDGETDISMEIEVLESHKDDFQRENIDTFVFTGVTLIGIRPAIENAKAVALNFSDIEISEFIEETKTTAIKEFSSRYSSLDFKIPSGVKKSAKEGLDLYKKHGKGGNAVALSIARHFANSDFATPEKIRMAAKKLSKFSGNLDDKEGNDWITYQLHGGNAGKSWSVKLSQSMDELDKKMTSYFTGSEDEEFEKKEVTYMEEDKEKQEEVKEEKMAEEEKPENEKQEDKKDEFAETKEEENKEDPKEEANETSEEEKKEGKEEPEKEKMSNDQYVDIAAALAFLQAETEANQAMAEEEQTMFSEMQKGQECNMSVFAKGLFARYQKMCNKMSEMSAKFAEMEENYKKMSAENEELKKFKVEQENAQKKFSVDVTLKELESFVPANVLDELRADSQNYSLDEIDTWKNKAKSRGFDFSKDKKPSDNIVRIGLPWNGNGVNKSDQIWK